MAYTKPGLDLHPPHVVDLLAHPGGLRQALTERGVFEFPQSAEGLFPASDLSMLSPEDAQATGMADHGWWRDGVHIQNALLNSANPQLVEQGVRFGKAVFASLERDKERVLDLVVNGSDPTKRLPARLDIHTLEEGDEQRNQHDATAYRLISVVRSMREGHIKPTRDSLELIAQTARYLDTPGIDYLSDPEQGAWEEDLAIHAPTIGVVKAGLQRVHALFQSLDFHPQGLDLREMIEQSDSVMHAIVAQGYTKVAGRGQRFEPQRPFDAAMLFPVRLGALGPEIAQKVLHDIGKNLLREKGVIRYAGDTYYMPGFDRVPIEERTTDAEGRIEARNAASTQVEQHKTEAQWPLFDPIQATEYAMQALNAQDPLDQALALQKHAHHLERTLAHLVPQADSRLRAPELYFYKDGKLTENPHSSLLWMRAMVLDMTVVHEKVRARFAGPET